MVRSVKVRLSDERRRDGRPVDTNQEINICLVRGRGCAGLRKAEVGLCWGRPHEDN